MAGLRAAAARWATHVFVVGLLATIALLATLYGVYRYPPPDDCFDEELWWVDVALLAPLGYAVLWLAMSVAYLLVPRSERGPMGPTRWSMGLGVLLIPMFVFVSFVLTLMFFDCNH